MSNSTKRIRFTVDSSAEQRIKEAAESSGRTVSGLIKMIIMESTKNLTDFSIIDNANFSRRVVKPRYHSIEARMRTSEQVSILTDAARKRGRTVPSLIYHVTSRATEGFTNFNIGEVP